MRRPPVVRLSSRTTSGISTEGESTGGDFAGPIPAEIAATAAANGFCCGAAVDHVATVSQILDLWQDPQECYDIFMNNFTERT